MVNVQRRFWAYVVVLMISLLVVFPADAEPPADKNQSAEVETEKATKVIYLIIADGLQADVLKSVSAPNIKGLSSAGLSVERVGSFYHDDSSAVIAGILTGSLLHQVNTQSMPSLNNTGILKLMQNNGIKTSLFDGTEKMAVFKEGLTHACKGPFNGKDSLVIDNVIKEVEEFNTYFNVVILPELKTVAEKYGADSSEYQKQVTATDNQIGRLLHHLHTNGLYNQSLIIVTGTSGKPPLIMKGPQLKAGVVLPPANLTDIAPTIAYLTGQSMKDCEGMVLYNALQPREGGTESYLLSQRVSDLSNAYADALDGMHRLEQEKLEVKEQQMEISNEKQAIQQKIVQRDEKINQLSKKIYLMKMSGILVFAVLIFGYVIEYKLLRKKFLMF